MTNRQLWRKYAAENLAIEKKYYSRFARAIRLQVNQFADDLVLYGQTTAVSNLTLSGWNAQLSPILQALYRQAGLRGAIRAYSELKRDTQKLRGFGFNEQWIREVLDFLNQNILNKVVLPISETTIKYCLKVISESLDKGWTFEEMANFLKRSELPEWRARLISRTETIRAANVGHAIGAKSFPYEVQKIWVSARDHRVRHTHRLVNNERVDENALFSNGLLYPGDMNAPAKEVCNCRCRVTYKAKRDPQGRIIPRQQPVVNILPSRASSSSAIASLVGSSVVSLLSGLLSETE